MMRKLSQRVVLNCTQFTTIATHIRHPRRKHARALQTGIRLLQKIDRCGSARGNALLQTGQRGQASGKVNSLDSRYALKIFQYLHHSENNSFQKQYANLLRGKMRDRLRKMNTEVVTKIRRA